MPDDHDRLPMRLAIELPGWAPSICDPDRPYATDEEKMRLAIELARQNTLQKTGGPFGAAVFRSSDDSLLSVGVNLVAPLCNSVLHAEIVAFMFAERAIGSHTLKVPAMSPHVLFTSCEPCAMCLGAILWSGVRRVVYAAQRTDAMEIGFEEGPVFPQSYEYLRKREIELVQGPLRDEARAVLRLYQQSAGTIYNG